MLSKDELRTGLLELGILQAGPEAEMLFDFLDADRSGSVDIAEFTDLVRGQLTRFRRGVVDEAFRSLDVRGEGAVRIDVLRERLRTFGLPSVMSGAKTQEQAQGEWLEGFDFISQSGSVSHAAFVSFYEAVSPPVSSDAVFEASVRDTWGLPQRDASGLSSGGLRFYVTCGDIDPLGGTPRQPRPGGGRSGGCGGDGTGTRAAATEALAERPAEPSLGRTTSTAAAAATRQEVVELFPAPGDDLRKDPGFLEAVRQRLEEGGYRDVRAVQAVGNA